MEPSRCYDFISRFFTALNDELHVKTMKKKTTRTPLKTPWCCEIQPVHNYRQTMILSKLSKFFAVHKSQKAFIRSQITFGFNQVVKNISRSDFSVILVNNGIKPRILLDHIDYLCKGNKIECLMIDNLEHFTQILKVKKVIMFAIKKIEGSLLSTEVLDIIKRESF
ncbi:hypothetical protein RF11_15760 [Thelohanellus kitauei]|uniref:Ribosomal protein eL8/eL30/eS12/Gadd45 domain-containing protein n=1 Tax=Thelohanellus kitauei TaxID=669202 RepID=A0A0C2MNV7_THEKT|nr:hypothetical protein RF11_15760 [Thelohanellus kitauei]